MSTTLFGVSPAAASAAPVASAPIPAPAPAVPAVAPVPAPVPDSATGQVNAHNTAKGKQGGVAARCVFSTRGDYVHISSSAFEASGHGWWVNGDCPASLARVTVQLQEYYSDGRWRNKGTVGRKTVRSGGGAGNRATGRAHCDNHHRAGWRSVIDVDLVGLHDDARKLVTPARNIGCTRL
ncbi:MAG TPA: hypothetical protein VF069_15300 [Streptosporangiaceae bacterium]